MGGEGAGLGVDGRRERARQERKQDVRVCESPCPAQSTHSLLPLAQLHRAHRPQAEAFALLSEEGIAKGVRRIVAVTRGEAAKAIAEAARLRAELAAVAALPDAELEKATKAFKEVRQEGVWRMACGVWQGGGRGGMLCT